jgi:hypothetical protein
MKGKRPRTDDYDYASNKENKRNKPSEEYLEEDVSNDGAETMPYVVRNDIAGSSDDTNSLEDLDLAEENNAYDRSRNAYDRSRSDSETDSINEDSSFFLINERDYFDNPDLYDRSQAPVPYCDDELSSVANSDDDIEALAETNYDHIRPIADRSILDMYDAPRFGMTGSILHFDNNECG